jgi:hypothetical protein
MPQLADTICWPPAWSCPPMRATGAPGRAALFMALDGRRRRFALRKLLLTRARRDRRTTGRIELPAGLHAAPSQAAATIVTAEH